MLKDKVIVITGAGRGLGKALASECAKKGAKVVVSARTEKEIREIGDAVRGLAVKADVTKEKDIENLLQTTLKRFGKIDVWINNAGIWLPESPIEKMDMKRVEEVFRVNVFGLMAGSKIALSYMKEQGSGTILNIISSSALFGRNGIAPYSTSKWAARGFTECLKEETKGTHITVISAYPGGMKTNLFDEQPPNDYEKYMEVEPIAEKLIENLEKENPEQELIMKRPTIK
jgi:3-oxoacyl-[acyl-carrier protein] reductase